MLFKRQPKGHFFLVQVWATENHSPLCLFHPTDVPSAPVFSLFKPQVEVFPTNPEAGARHEGCLWKTAEMCFWHFHLNVIQSWGLSLTFCWEQKTLRSLCWTLGGSKENCSDHLLYKNGWNVKQVDLFNYNSHSYPETVFFYEFNSLVFFFFEVPIMDIC